MNNHLFWSMTAIVAYTIFCIWFGFVKGYTKDVVSSHRGFLLGPGVGPVILFFTTAATSYSAFIFMGAPGNWFRQGIGWGAVITWQLVGIYLMGVWSPKMWRLGADRGYITPADLVQDYYNPKGKGVRLSVAITQLAFCIPTLMAQVGGGGLAIYILTGGLIPFWVACLYIAGVTGFYCYFGGFKSQAWVDTAQGTMFTLALVGAVIVMMRQPELGGIAGMFQRLEEVAPGHLLYRMPGEGGFIWRNWMSFFLINSIGITLSPYMLQRSFAAKDGRAIIKKLSVLGIMMTFGIQIAVMLAGLGGTALGVDPANADSILVDTMNLYAPAWGILLVIGIIACAMSTISSISVSISSLVTVDIVKTFKPEASTVQLRNIARYCVLGMIVVSMIGSIFGTSGVVILIATAMAGFAQLFWPLFGIFVWKRVSKEGMLIGYLVGVIFTAVFHGLGINPLGFMPGMVGFALNGALMFIISALTKPIDSEYRTQYLEPLVRYATRK